MYGGTYVGTREEQCHANFLVSAAQYANSISSRALKAHLNILCSDTLRMKNYATRWRGKKTENCQYCLSPFTNGDFSLKLLPFGKRGKKLRKILRKAKENQALGKIERKIAEERDFKNVMLLKCLVCTKEVKFKLRKRDGEMNLRGMDKKSARVKKRKRRVREDNVHRLNPRGMAVLGGVTRERQNKGIIPDEIKPLGVGNYCAQNGDADEIEITYEHRPPAKIRKIEVLSLKHKKAAKKRGKKKIAAENLVPITPVGVLGAPPTAPYNASEDAAYNSPFVTAYSAMYNAGCATTDNMQYNTPYGIPYSMQYNTQYSDQAPYGPSYSAPYNMPYDGAYANAGGYDDFCVNQMDAAAEAAAETSRKKKKRKRKRKREDPSKNENAPNDISGKDFLINPFSDKVQEIIGLPKKKKLSQWKRLIAEADKKPVRSHSLKDFLAKL